MLCVWIVWVLLQATVGLITPFDDPGERMIADADQDIVSGVHNVFVNILDVTSVQIIDVC